MPNPPAIPQSLHVEQHFTATETVRDIVIGMSDGLTVPFALAAGLSGAVASTALVVTAGFAEIAAGSIAMGLGGYLAAKTDIEHYCTERLREVRETQELPEKERAEVRDIFREYGLPEDQLDSLVGAIASDRERWVDFMMRFELGLESPNPARARWSALTIALSYIVGGMIPLAPYLIFNSIHRALMSSIIFTLVALLIFGYVKGRFTGLNPVRGAIQTLFIGGLAAAVAFAIAKLVG